MGGLLCARRLLSTLSVKVDDEDVSLATLYPGVEEVTAEVNTCEDEDTKRKYYVNALDRDEDEEVRYRPFRAFLDVGVRRTTKGCRIFGALKGAVDGGMDIPHNEKLFPGYTNEDGQVEYDADMHRSMIFGVMIGEYMSTMQEEDEERYEAHFKKYIEAGITADNIEDKIGEVHEAIRADPSPKHAEPVKARQGDHAGRSTSVANRKRLTYESRKARVEAKLEAIAEALAGGDDDSE